jgi:Rod binding domain-containing protein
MSDPKPSVGKMASEFESMLLTQLLKDMRQTLEGDSLFGDDPGDVQGGLFDYFMGKHLADNGGIGLAAALIRQMPTEKTGTAGNDRNERQQPERTGGDTRPVAPA